MFSCFQRYDLKVSVQMKHSREARDPSLVQIKYTNTVWDSLPVLSTELSVLSVSYGRVYCIVSGTEPRCLQ